MAVMVGSTNHSIKQVIVDEKGVNRCGEEEQLVLDAETEVLVEEEPIYKATEEVIGKPTMVIKERVLLVPELKKCLGEEVTEEHVT